MASGKSLELQKIRLKPPSPVCICGATYFDHMRKDGKGPLAKFSDPEKHRPIVSGTPGVNRRMRRAARRGRA